ncbi:MAG: ABC transporter substrate-binding protein [Betaproteobacteria bacterium]|nr:ABC transporter substrate-binding protein [Betaproteobacteria bacterium]
MNCSERASALNSFLCYLILAAGLCIAVPVLAQGAGPFKIGIASDMSSAYSDLSGKGSLIAVQLAIEDFGGSVLGRKIEVVSADHQMKPSVGSSLVTEWFDRSNVSAVFGLAGSSVALAVQAIAKDRPTKAVIHTIPLTSELIGKSCLPNAIHWAPDSYALAAAVTRYMTRQGGKSWFIMVQDTAAGPPARAAAADGILKGGGKIAGDVRVPFNAGDVSSFVLQAQSSRANLIAVGFGGADLINIVKAGRQFGIEKTGAAFVSLALFGPDIEGMGLDLAKGIAFVMPFYPEMNAEARAWSKRFQDRAGRLPAWSQVADYEGVLHYLRAVQKAGTDDAQKVVPIMKSAPINTFSIEGGVIREDHQLVRPMYLAKVKAPDQSKFPGDFYDIIGKVPASEVFSPLADSACPMVKK